MAMVVDYLASKRNIPNWNGVGHTRSELEKVDIQYRLKP